LPKPNCEDLSANFRISCTAKHRKVSLQGAVLNTEDATMKSLSTKLVLSALGVALLSGSALAQKPADQYLANQYLADQYKVVVRGQIVGADPDAQIRTQLSREWDFRYGE
jgi:hypothetical protein